MSLFSCSFCSMSNILKGVSKAMFNLPHQELCQFMMLAKQNTFAKNADPSASKCLLSKNYIFEADDFRYEDQYFGEIVDVGEEIIWYRGIPVWGMGYRGGIHKAFINERNDAFQFLCEALSMPEPTFPVRGPNRLKGQNYLYENKPDGDIFNFTGNEIISRHGIEICFRRYVGGLIYGEHNADMRII